VFQLEWNEALWTKEWNGMEWNHGNCWKIIMKSLPEGLGGVSSPMACSSVFM
jgi:hypothetical protein